MADVIETGGDKSATPSGGATPNKAGVTTSEAVLKRYGVTIRDLTSVTKTDYVPSPSMQHLKRQFFKEQSVSMSDGSLKFLPTDLVFAMHAVARGMSSYSYGHMRALMLWMTYLAGLETRRNEEYIQNLQNRLETGNRQLFKRNKYFFLPQNREVRRSKFAGSYDQSTAAGDDDIIVDEVIRATSGTPTRGTPPARARGRARGRGFGPPARGGGGAAGAGGGGPAFGGRPQAGPPMGSPPGVASRGFPSPFDRRGVPDRRGGLTGPPPPGAANERSPDLRGLRVLQSRNPPTSGPSFFGRLGGGAPLGLAAQQGNFKQPEISLMLDCEDDPLSPAQMDKYRKDVENYKITLKAQKYLNSSGPRSYSSNDYSNDLPEPDEHDDDVEEAAPPPPPPAPAAPRTAQLALPAPPKGMRPGPRTAKLAQQLGKQGTEKSKSNLQYIVQNGKLVLVQGQAAPPVQMQLKTKGPPGKPASAQARSLPPRTKGSKRGADADFDPGHSKGVSSADAPLRTSSRARTATKAFDLSEIESEESAAKQKMSEESKKTKPSRVEKTDKLAKSSSASTSKEATAASAAAAATTAKDAAAAAAKGATADSTTAAPSSKEAKQAAIRAAAKQGALLAAKAAKPKYVKPAGKGNWLPIHEYYYGRKNGDPAYVEQKGEFRFKCWHCEKMLYNNLKAVNHVIGHIDANKQKSVDLAELTSCKQCFSDFDSPFEMQCHAEKEHFSNQKLLMCRICDKNLQSEDGLKVHMSTVHTVCDMPYRCTLCQYRSSIYTDLVDHFKKRHSGSSNVICLYCTRIFTLQKVGTNEDSAYCRTQNFYIHLQKHQVNTMQKRCNGCLLTFLSTQDLKAHRVACHGPNKVATKLSTFSRGDSTLIFVPEKTTSSNAPSTTSPSKSSSEMEDAAAADDEDARVDAGKDYAGMTLRLRQEIDCVECKSSMNQVAHYKKFVECGLCPFATSCSQAYNNHMTAFHAGEKGRVVPKDRPIANFEEVIDFGDDEEDDFIAALGGTPKDKPDKEPPRLPPVPWWCACGFSTMYGNDLCDHLIHCSRRTAYAEKPETRFVEIDAEIDESDDEPEEGAVKTSSTKTIFDALGLQPKVVEGGEGEESESERVAEEEEEEERQGGGRADVQKTLNKMLDKVCGKSKFDEEEDVATILRKPIDFTKSDKLEEPLEAEDEEEEDDADSTELPGEIGAALRALEGDGDKDSDNDSDRSSSWAADEEGKTDVARLEDVAEADEGERKTKKKKKDDEDEDYDEKMDDDDEEEGEDEEEAMDDEEKEEKGLRTGGKRRMKKRVQRKIMDSDSEEDGEDGGKKRKKMKLMEEEEEEEKEAEGGEEKEDEERGEEEKEEAEREGENEEGEEEDGEKVAIGNEEEAEAE